jgi:hypothetical protein
MSKLIATTTTRVNLRQGPGTNHAILVTMPAQSKLEVVTQGPDWHKVTFTNQTGFVHKDFVKLATVTEPAAPVTPAPSKPAPTPPAPVPPAPTPVVPGPRQSVGANLGDLPLTPPAEKLLRVNPKDQLLNRLSASIWNKYGNLMNALAGVLQIEAAVGIAVFAVESGGFAFDPKTNKMIIRFENQVFFDQWGKKNVGVYDQHFIFNPTQRWLGHQWRPTPNEPWRPTDKADFHGNQDREWEVFNFACRFNEEAAKKSISMGAPQIMGFNHTVCGYASATEMFAAFAGSDRHQVVGFFDFVQGSTSNSKRVAALQAQDFTAFAAQYNGPGQAAKYGGLIKTTYDAFNVMKAAAGI